jgi:hypothetical protein
LNSGIEQPEKIAADFTRFYSNACPDANEISATRDRPFRPVDSGAFRVLETGAGKRSRAHGRTWLRQNEEDDERFGCQ